MISREGNTQVKIVDVKATPVYVEMEAPLLWSMGVEHGTTRTVIQLYTDEGIAGLGETYGGAATARRFEEARPLFIGLDPFELQTMFKQFEIIRVSSEQMARAAEMIFVGADFEMAIWGIVGKALDKPLYRLWGGASDTFVPFVADAFYRYGKDGIGGERTPEDIVRRYGERIERQLAGLGLGAIAIDLELDAFELRRLLPWRFKSETICA